MRAKRIVSVLLAAIMLMGMIPMNAMAALTPDNPSKKDMAEFKLMISDSFGAVLPGQDGKNIDIKTATEYKNLSRNANYDSVFDKYTTDAKILKTNLEKCESVFTPDEDGVLDGVEPGSTIYVGVKAKIMNPETYKGVVAYGAYIKYDATKFEPIVGNAVGSGEAAKKAYQGTVITNHLGAGTLNSSAGLNDEYELVNSDDVTKYFGSYKLDTASAIGVDEGDPNIEYLGVVTKSANINYFPSESTWDFIVPMKVKAITDNSGYGLSDFEIISKANKSFTEVVLSKGVYDGATDLQGDTVKTAINDSETTTRNCIASNDVSVNIVKFSTPPTPEVDYTGSIVNNKNMPYLTERQAAATANQGYGPYDYITFPQAETRFVTGDTVVVYADDKGSQELGRTLLAPGNFYDSTGLDATDSAVNGKAMKLLDSEGKSYITNQSKLWIGRLQPGQGMAVNKKALVGIDITPENPLYYNGNVDAVTKEGEALKLGTRENPIEVQLGGSINDALKQIDRTTLETAVEAPAEGNATISTTVDWTSWVAAHTTGNGNLYTDTFDVHGLTTIVAPFADKTISGTDYKQPAAMVAGDGTALDVPVYGAALYVNVVGNPADFSVVYKTGSPATKTIQFLGSTAAALQQNDKVSLYTDELGADSIAEITIGEAGAAQKITIDDAAGKIDELVKVTPAQLYVKVEQNSVKPAAVSNIFPVAITDGTPEVAGNVVIKGDGPNGEVLIDPAATVQGIFNDLNPEFGVTGDDIGSIQVPVLKTKTPFDANKVVLSKVGESGYNTVASFDAQKNKEAASTTKFTYTIPADSYTPDGGSEVTYNNTNSYTISFTTSVVTSIKLGDGGANDTIKITMLQNEPDFTRDNSVTKDGLENVVNWDTFIVQGDVFGYEKPNNAPKLDHVQVGDEVTVFLDGSAEAYAKGYVFICRDNGVDDADGYNGKKGTKTYFLKVDQLGRNPDLSKLSFRINRPVSANSGDLLPTRTIPFVAPGQDASEVIAIKEPYSYLGVVPYSPDTFVVNNANDNGNPVYSSVDDFYNKQTALPKAATVTYGYYKYNGTSYVVDEATKGTVSIDFPQGAKWTSKDEIADISGFNGVNQSKYDFALSQDMAAQDGTPIKQLVTNPLNPTDGIKASEELTVKVDLVSEAYNGPDVTTVLAPAITVENNPYPQPDKVKIEQIDIAALAEGENSQESPALTVYFYTSEADALANKNAVADVLVANGESLKLEDIVVSPADRANQGTAAPVLSADGSQLWFRAKGAHTLLSDPGTVVYESEDYTFWGASIADSSKKVALNRDQIQNISAETPRTSEEQLKFIKNALAEQFEIKAVRFIKDSNGEVVPDLENAKTSTVKLTDKWNKSADGQPLTEADINKIIGPAGDVTSEFTATITAEDIANVKVKTPAGGGAVILNNILFTAPTGAPAQPDDFNKVQMELLVAGGEEGTVFEIVANAADYIVANNQNTLDKSDDTVEIRFATQNADGQWVPTDPSMLAADPEANPTTFSFTVTGDNGPVTITGTLTASTENAAGGASYAYALVNMTNYSDFPGLSTETESLSVVFVRGDKSSTPVAVAVSPITGAVDIVKVEMNRNLALYNDTIKKNSDLLKLVSDKTKATVTLDTKPTQTTAEVDLVKEPGGASNSGSVVAWSLWVGTKSGDDTLWASEPVASADWVSTLKTYAADKTYKLTAELDIASYTDKVLENSSNMLAEIPISLYDKTNPSSFPVQLKEGNSDLYKYGAVEGERANKEIAKRNLANGTALTNESFKTDAVFYYYYDSYGGYESAEKDSQMVKTYVEAGMKEMIGTKAMAEGAFQEWLASNPDSWKVEELTAAGEPISQDTYDASGNKIGATTHIDPRNSLDKSKYVVPLKTYERLEEEYIIRYTVDYEGTLYVADRKVILTYKPGDINFDMTVSQNDGIDATNIYGSMGALKVFAPTEEDRKDGEKMAELERLHLKVADINGDGTVSQNDGIDLNNIYGSLGALMPKIRW